MNANRAEKGVKTGMPKVSICIPTHNQARFIRDCVESALNQTLRNIEVVVSVNHCTDGTDEVLSSFSDPRLRIVRPPRYLPVAGNFKFCIAQSRGGYINYLASDDLLLPGFAESQAEVLDRYPRVAFVHCAAERIDESGRTIRLEKSIRPSFIRKGQTELKRYIKRMSCAGDSLLIRREAYETAGGIGDSPLVDWDLCLRLLQCGDVAYNDRVLIKYRDWSDDYRGGTRRWEAFLARVLLYEEWQNRLVPVRPELGKIFRKARSAAARRAIVPLMEGNLAPRNEAKAQILRLSDSWSVRLKMSLVERGWGFLWLAKHNLLTRARSAVKPLFYR